jgi:DNA-binding response OmpR family regulator
MTTRVLVIEDDPGIRMVLRTALSDEGFAVVESATGEEALAISQQEELDLALVDLRLPGIQGLDVVRSLRGFGQLPIIIVTAMSDSHDVVAGLEAGADDYIVKPFVAKELTARVRALLRRAGSAERADGSLVVGDLEVRPDTMEVLLRGHPLPLSRTEYLVLQRLAEANGAVLSRSQLLHDVWGYSYTGDGRVVDNLVYRLRAKIEDDPADPQVLLTARGFGYRLQP